MFLNLRLSWDKIRYLNILPYSELIFFRLKVYNCPWSSGVYWTVRWENTVIQYLVSERQILTVGGFLLFFGFLHIHLIVICMKMEKYPVVITEMTKRKHVNVIEHGRGPRKTSLWYTTTQLNYEEFKCTLWQKTNKCNIFILPDAVMPFSSTNWLRTATWPTAAACESAVLSSGRGLSCPGAGPAMDSRCSSVDSRLTGRGLGSVSSTPLSARVESYEAGEKKCISDVRRTFCLFVTFDLLFITLLWIIELNVRQEFLHCVSETLHVLKYWF